MSTDWVHGTKAMHGRPGQVAQANWPTSRGCGRWCAAGRVWPLLTVPGPPLAPARAAAPQPSTTPPTTHASATRAVADCAGYTCIAQYIDSCPEYRCSLARADRTHGYVHREHGRRQQHGVGDISRAWRHHKHGAVIRKRRRWRGAYGRRGGKGASQRQRRRGGQERAGLPQRRQWPGQPRRGRGRVHPPAGRRRRRCHRRRNGAEHRDVPIDGGCCRLRRRHTLPRRRRRRRSRRLRRRYRRRLADHDARAVQAAIAAPCQQLLHLYLV